MSGRCHDCERPLAQDVDGNMTCADGCMHCAALCWRLFQSNTCQSPIDWRARALAAEAECQRWRDSMGRSLADWADDHLPHVMIDMGMVTMEIYRRMEGRLTAERDQLKAEVERLRASREALIDELSTCIPQSAAGLAAALARIEASAMQLADERDQLKRGLAEALEIADEVGSSGEGQTREYLDAVHARIAELRKRAGL